MKIPKQYISEKIQLWCIPIPESMSHVILLVCCHIWSFWQLIPFAPGQKPNLSWIACNLPFLLGRNQKYKISGIRNKIGFQARDWKKKTNQTTMFAIYNHFRGRKRTTEKEGFSQNTNSDNTSLPRFKTNEVSNISKLSAVLHERRWKNPNPLKCTILTVYKNGGSMVKAF